MSHLPGSIPGILRRGSPVVLSVELWMAEVDGFVPVGVGGVVRNVTGDEATVAFDTCSCDHGNDCGALWEAPLSSLFLDTSDPTGAFHARMWAGTDAERLEVILAAGVETNIQAVPVVYQTPTHGGWRHENDGYTHESGWRVSGNGMRSWLLAPPPGGIVKELPVNITGVKCHGFTVRADVAELMDLADKMIAEAKAS